MMREIPITNKYERKITPNERIFSRSPSATIAVVARIKGNISEKMLINAVSQVQQRHPNLRVRIKVDSDRRVSAKPAPHRPISANLLKK